MKLDLLALQADLEQQNQRWRIEPADLRHAGYVPADVEIRRLNDVRIVNPVAKPPPRPCLAGDCRRPLWKGHSYCAGHYRLLEQGCDVTDPYEYDPRKATSARRARA